MKNKTHLLASFLIGFLTMSGFGFAFAAPLVTAPVTALAASGICSNSTIGGAITGWAWIPPSNGVPGDVVFSGPGGQFDMGPYPLSVNPPSAASLDSLGRQLAQVDGNWKEIDDTAPILWGYKSGVTGIVGNINELFTSQQCWTLQVAQKMADQHFSPTMVGGVMGPVIGPNGNVVPDPITNGGGSSDPTQKMETITVNASPVNYYVGGQLATPANGMFNNQNVVTVSDSFVYKKTTFVPIRFAAKLLGQPVAWNGTQYGVDITANSSATPPPGSTTVLHSPSKPDIMQIMVNATPMHFYVGGADKTPKGNVFDNQGVTTLDGFVYDKTTYVPIRLAAELLNQSIQWDSKHYSVDIGTPPTSANTGPTTKTTGAVASATALSYPSVVTSPPAGSASRAANGIKQDDKLFASGGSSAAPSKSSPLKVIVMVLVLAGLVVGVVLFIRWRRERAIYSTKNMRRLM